MCGRRARKRPTAYRRTTVSERHAWPAALNAFTVIVFVPGINGTFADHVAVPVAVPPPPVELLHVTLVVFADAVPLTIIVAAEVETMVKPGEVIFRAGGVPAGDVGATGAPGVGGGFPGGAVVVAAWRVIVNTRDAMLPALSDAVTVMMFVPMFSGTTGILQFAEPLALP